MNKKLLSLLSIIFLFSFFVQTTQAQDKKNVNIGIIHDGFAEESHKFIENLNKELISLLGSEYNVNIPNDKIMNADWSAENAAIYYQKLNQDSNIDIILGCGPLSSSVIAQEKKSKACYCAWPC